MGPMIKCKLCEDIIRSTYRHDMQWCKCGAIAVDGGSDYTKLTGHTDNIEVVRTYEEDLEGIKKDINTKLCGPSPFLEDNDE